MKNTNTLKHRRLTEKDIFAFEAVTAYALKLSLKREQKLKEAAQQRRLKQIARSYKQTAKNLEFKTQLF